MKAPLFDTILEISQGIADASSKNNDTERTSYYQQLIKLCASNENSVNDHPLQWEALGDFTNDSEQAIDIYQKGLDCAEKLQLVDYTASIYLTMAQRFEEMEETDKMQDYASKANELVPSIKSDELIQDINDFFGRISG